MPNTNNSYKEIVTKAVLGKGKKLFTTTSSLQPNNLPTTILGCWVINHTFNGHKESDKIIIDGAFDVNVWYSYDQDTKTEVVSKKDTYKEEVTITKKEESDLPTTEEVIVRNLKQPNVTKVEIRDGIISYSIEKELGIELVGDTKVKIVIDNNPIEWDVIDDNYLDDIEDEVSEDYLDN